MKSVRCQAFQRVIKKREVTFLISKINSVRCFYAPTLQRCLCDSWVTCYT